MKSEASEDAALIRGMIIGFVLSIPIWAVIVLVVWGLVAWL